MTTKTAVKQQLATLDQLIASSAKFDKKKVDLEGAPASLWVNTGGRWGFNQEVDFMGQKGVDVTRNLHMETNGLRQLLSRLSVPFFGKGSGTTMDAADWEMLMKKYPKQFAAIINDLTPQVESKGLIVRTHDKNIRAVLTDRYGIVDNTEVLQAIYAILTEVAPDLKDLRVVTSTVDRDRLDLRIVFAEGNRPNPNDPTPQGETRRGDGNYGYGVSLTNEETGRGGLSLWGLVWRGPCTNGIRVKTPEAINLRHIGKSNIILGRVKQSFMDVLPVAAEALDRVYAVSNKSLGSITDVVAGLAKQHGWSEDTTKQILVGTEGQETVMGLVNGVSYAATKQETAEARADMEVQAGAILTAPDSLFARAAQVAVTARKG